MTSSVSVARQCMNGNRRRRRHQSGRAANVYCQSNESGYDSHQPRREEVRIMMVDDVITLKKLQVLLTFMEVNNLTRAAELLDQSVVSVHRALHSLEEGLRCPLFKRVGRNLVPLPAAYAFANYSQRALAEVGNGVRKAREVAGFEAESLKLGSLYSLTLRCIPQLMVGLKNRKPDLHIDLTMGSNRELLQGLDDGR